MYRPIKRKIKPVVSATVQNLFFNLNISPMLAKRGSSAKVLMFHGIGVDEHSSELFRQKILFLKKHFRIVSLDHLIAKMEANENLDNEVVLTFDDGLKNNAVHAYPILKQYGVPATFYVCPGLIDSGSWLWTHEARERLRSLPLIERSMLATSWGCKNDLEDMMLWLKSLDIMRRVELEKTICHHTLSFRPSADQRNAYDVMSWENLKDLDETLITIGSHTTNHAITKALSDETLLSEIVDSKALLEQHLGRPIKHFCYPDGCYDDVAVTAVKSVYQSAVTTIEGFVAPADNRYILKRVPSESSLSNFAWRLVRPAS